jgi:glycosyltransferase involved in cell wall biosynthesis
MPIYKSRLVRGAMRKFLLLFLTLFSVVYAQGSQPALDRKKVCLNMIVKDESEAIESCLASVKGLIDYWVIVDTGSKDGTQEIVKNFLKDIPGELLERPWVNFEHNRNEALIAAKGKGDYLLFLDADEIWQHAENYTLPALDHDYYYVVVRQLGAVDFKRIGLVNAQLDWKWNGVIHEVLECPLAKTYATLRGVIDVCNELRGARAKVSDTASKDASLLEKAIKKDPTNSRYMYYLGQSYMNSQKYEQSLKAFERRCNMESSDIHETFMALYQVGIAHEKMDDFDSAIKSYFKAYQFRPTRAEPLFRAAVLYRKQGNYLLGYLLSKYALSIPTPTEDLCFEYLTYDYALLIEFANCALLLGRFQEGLEACHMLLANPNLPSDIKPQVISNLEMARKNIVAKEHMKLDSVPR